jgi:hypothetical protein
MRVRRLMLPYLIVLIVAAPAIPPSGLHAPPSSSVT